MRVQIKKDTKEGMIVRIGEILLELGYLNESQIEEILNDIDGKWKSNVESQTSCPWLWPLFWKWSLGFDRSSQGWRQEVSRWWIKIHPGQKTIIASGYAKTKEVDIAQKLGAGKYIKKPYPLEKVGVAVKEELEK